jgi:hypothetical protein
VTVRFTKLVPIGGALLLAGALAGCATAPRNKPDEYLDPVTAAMVGSAAQPLVFARPHQDVSSNSRQYVTIAPVSVNRSGHYEYLLLVYHWSTVDPRLGADTHPGDNLVLLADDRAIRLVRDRRTLKEAGISHPLHAPPHVRGQPRLYRIDKPTLQFLGNARSVRLQLEGDEDARPFDLWIDARPALARFLAAN